MCLCIYIYIKMCRVLCRHCLSSMHTNDRCSCLCLVYIDVCVCVILMLRPRSKLQGSTYLATHCNVRRWQVVTAITYLGSWTVSIGSGEQEMRRRIDYSQILCALSPRWIDIWCSTIVLNTKLQFYRLVVLPYAYSCKYWSTTGP